MNRYVYYNAAGAITMDKDRNAKKSLVVLKVVVKSDAGKISQNFEFVDRVNP